MPTLTKLIGLGMPPELANVVVDGEEPNKVNATAAGVRTIQKINNVTDAGPTQAEMVTAFGSAASTGSGFIGVIKDADADTNFFICISNGVSYYFLKLTKGA